MRATKTFSVCFQARLRLPAGLDMGAPLADAGGTSFWHEAYFMRGAWRHGRAD